jgi:hypothetical protein
MNTPQTVSSNIIETGVVTFTQGAVSQGKKGGTTGERKKVSVLINLNNNHYQMMHPQSMPAKFISQRGSESAM